MFPGQPLIFGAESSDDTEYQAIRKIALAHTGLDIHDLSWSREPSTKSVALQIYGAAISLYRNRLLFQEGRRPDMIAEHSMGIYAALASSGSISEGAALELTFRIGACIALMADRGDYALGCMVGLTHEPLLAIAENNGVFLANHNTSRHFLLSGERLGIESAVAEALAERGFLRQGFSLRRSPAHSAHGGIRR